MIFIVKSREVGKKIRHCPNLQIEDKALQDYLTTLTSLLDEVAKIATGNDAIEAKEKIIQVYLYIYFDQIYIDEKLFITFKRNKKSNYCILYFCGRKHQIFAKIQVNCLK